LKEHLIQLFEALVLSPKSDKANVKLRSIYKSLYHSPCSVFRHSWLPLGGDHLSNSYKLWR